MGKPTICIGENKDADQLRGNLEADQRLCFRYSDSRIPLLLKSEISSFLLFSVLVQAGLCRTCSETTLLVFPRGGSFNVGKTFQNTKLMEEEKLFLFFIPQTSPPVHVEKVSVHYLLNSWWILTKLSQIHGWEGEELIRFW